MLHGKKITARADRIKERADRTKERTFAVGFPPPWPLSRSIRIRSGFSPGLEPIVCCSSAMYLKLCNGHTRSSWSPGDQTLWGGKKHTIQIVRDARKLHVLYPFACPKARKSKRRPTVVIFFEEFIPPRRKKMCTANRILVCSNPREKSGRSRVEGEGSTQTHRPPSTLQTVLQRGTSALERPPECILGVCAGLFCAFYSLANKQRSEKRQRHNISETSKHSCSP